MILCRARREASLSGSEASSASSGSSSARSVGGASSSGFGEVGTGSFSGSGGVLHGERGGLADVYFSYSDAPGSPGGRPGRAASSGSSSPLAGRPRTAAMAARQAVRPFSALGRQQVWA